MGKEKIFQPSSFSTTTICALIILIPSVTANFTCPSNLRTVHGNHGTGCYCSETAANEYKINCQRNSTSLFDITIQPENFTRIQCRGTDLWYNGLQDVKLEIGNVAKFTFNTCQLLGSGNSERIIGNLGVKHVEHLQYENLLGQQLSPEDLKYFPLVKTLILNDNDLGDVDLELLRGLPLLKHLELRNTRIRIPEGFFIKGQSLLDLNLCNNYFPTLSTGIFDGLKKLRSLSLCNSSIKSIDPQSFRDLSTLQTIDLHRNDLENLTSDSFSELADLRVINLSYNNFASLPEDLFAKTSKLMSFEMNHNKADSLNLPNKLLAGLPVLVHVSMFGSKLRHLPADVVSGSKNITELNFGNNRLEKLLPLNLLNDLPELKVFNVTRNQLTQVSDNFFTSNGKLKILDISWNRLKAIERRTLLGLKSLEYLNLEHNQLSYIDLHAFASLGQLKVAKFANNNLAFNVSPFRPCQSLRSLDLSHNSLSDIFKDWLKATKLRDLNLSYNKFELLDSEDLQFASNDLQVNLSHNRISHINLTRIEQIAQKQYSSDSDQNRTTIIDVNDNPVRCDCDLYSFLNFLDGRVKPVAKRYVNFEIGRLYCSGNSGGFPTEGHPVKNLRASSLKCLVEMGSATVRDDPCAITGPCDCWTRPFDEALVMDCSNRYLKVSPSFVDARGQKCVELDLSGNNLSEAPSLRGSNGYGRICRLNLAGNSISRLSLENVASPNLTDLNVARNNLSTIDSDVLNYLSSDSVPIKNLTISQNPWRCDCSNRDFVNFVRGARRVLPSLRNVTCTTNNNNNKNVSVSIVDWNVDDDDSTCRNPDNVLKTVSSIAIVAIIAISCVLVACLYFERRIKIWLYSKKRCDCLMPKADPTDEDKTYDAFVSYSHEDGDFVRRELIKKLEAPSRPYRLCVHNRDWWVAGQMSKSMDESKRTIIVLSTNFLRTEWAEPEFREAHKRVLSDKKRKDRVIIILKGDVGSTDKLDKDLRAHVKNAIRWGDAWFWMKLKYALPHEENKHLKRNNMVAAEIKANGARDAVKENNCVDTKTFIRQLTSEPTRCF